MGVLRSPLVLVSGNVSQLPPGDFISGDTVTAVAGSGLVGGGADVNEFRFDVGVAAISSGLIFVGTKLAIDGVAQRTADNALASGNIAQATANQALSSGNLAITSGIAAQLTANTALSSGNAAQFTANQALSSGNLAVASGNASIALGLSALASGNAGIAQGLAGVRTVTGGSGLFVTPVGGSGFITVHSSGVTSTAGSGLVGGAVNSFSSRFDVALAAAPSGLIFVADKLGLDGSAQASGNAALVLAGTALASGNSGIAQALAGVTRVLAGSGVTLSPAGGSGVVTVHASGFSPRGSGTERVFFENQTHVSGSYTITAGCNAGSFGPITVASGVIVTVPSGSVWTVV